MNSPKFSPSMLIQWSNGPGFSPFTYLIESGENGISFNITHKNSSDLQSPEEELHDEKYDR